MTTQSLELLELNQVLTVCREGISKDSFNAVSSLQNVFQAVEKLRATGQLLDAASILAVALPQHSTIYWAWCCLSHYLKTTFSENSLKCLNAVEAWLSDDYSLQAGNKAWEASMAEDEPGAAGWLCKGVYWCGDNVVPPDIEVQQKILPPKTLSGQMSGLAVRMCAYICSPDNPNVICEQCLELGMQIVHGNTPEVK